VAVGRYVVVGTVGRILSKKAASLLEDGEWREVYSYLARL
jgi:hypothetical protein